MIGGTYCKSLVVQISCRSEVSESELNCFKILERRVAVTSILSGPFDWLVAGSSQRGDSLSAHILSSSATLRHSGQNLTVTFNLEVQGAGS